MSAIERCTHCGRYPTERADTALCASCRIMVDRHIDDLRAQLAAMTKERDELRARVEELEKQNQRLSERAYAAETDNAIGNKQYEHLQREHEALRERFKAIADAYHRLDNEHDYPWLGDAADDILDALAADGPAEKFDHATMCPKCVHINEQDRLACGYCDNGSCYTEKEPAEKCGTCNGEEGGE